MKNVYVKSLKKIISLVLLIQMVFSPGLSLAQVMPNSSQPENLVQLTPTYNPIIINGLKIYQDNPLRFDFIVDRGDTQLSADKYQRETEHLIRYFMASLAVPEKDMWVNLSPYEKNRILPDNFGKTQMGVDLLAQDYLLKQITASLMYPEGEIGKKFWAKVNEQARQKFNISEIPIETFNKVWIVPDVAEIYVNNNVAFIVKSRMKVMLEKDYLSMQNSRLEKPAEAVKKDSSEMSQMAAQVVKEIVIPALEKEVNEGEHFSLLRQIYNSMILATWYKYNVKNSVVNQMFSNQGKVGTTKVEDPAAKDQIYQNYVQSFKKGIYNYIVEENDPVSGETVPRKYFSGGVGLDKAQITAAGSPLVDALKRKLATNTSSFLTVAAELGLQIDPAIAKAYESGATGRLPSDLAELMIKYIDDRRIDVTSPWFHEQYPQTARLFESIRNSNKRTTAIGIGTVISILAGITSWAYLSFLGGESRMQREAPFLQALQPVTAQLIEANKSLLPSHTPIKVLEVKDINVTVLLRSAQVMGQSEIQMRTPRSVAGFHFDIQSMNPDGSYSTRISWNTYPDGAIVNSIPSPTLAFPSTNQALEVLFHLLSSPDQTAQKLAKPLVGTVLADSSSSPLVAELHSLATTLLSADRLVDQYLANPNALARTNPKAAEALLVAEDQQAGSPITSLKTALVAALMPFLLSAAPVPAESATNPAASLTTSKAAPTQLTRLEKMVSQRIKQLEAQGALTGAESSYTILDSKSINIYIYKVNPIASQPTYNFVYSDKRVNPPAVFYYDVDKSGKLTLSESTNLTWEHVTSIALALMESRGNAEARSFVEALSEHLIPAFRGIDYKDKPKPEAKIPATSFERLIGERIAGHEKRGNFAIGKHSPILFKGRHVEIYLYKVRSLGQSPTYDIVLDDNRVHLNPIRIKVDQYGNVIDMGMGDGPLTEQHLTILGEIVSESNRHRSGAAKAVVSQLVEYLIPAMGHVPLAKPAISTVPAPKTPFEALLGRMIAQAQKEGAFKEARGSKDIFVNDNFNMYLYGVRSLQGQVSYSVGVYDKRHHDAIFYWYVDERGNLLEKPAPITQERADLLAEALREMNAAEAQGKPSNRLFITTLQGLLKAKGLMPNAKKTASAATVPAEVTRDKVGGIDLDPGKAKFVIGGKTVEMIAPQNPIYYENLFNNEIVPNVMQIQTIPNLPAILGLNQADQNQPVKSAEAQTPADQISMMPGKEQEQQYN